jgi:hypothetical protein
MSARRTITITQVEFRAIVAAAALHAAEGEVQHDQPAEWRREADALTRVIRKWQGAGLKPGINEHTEGECVCAVDQAELERAERELAALDRDPDCPPSR